MARAPDERVKKALELYKAGEKLIDIANKLEVPPGTVRRWKSTYKWESEQSERSDKDSERSNKTKVSEAVRPKVEIKNDDLTEKQRLFCLYYVDKRNKVKAYQKAYDCSYAVACGNASTLWKNIEVQKEVNRLLDEFRENVKVDIQDLFQWHLDIARADINDFVTINGPMVQVKSNIDGVLVSEVSETATGIKVKLMDRSKSLQWLSENIGLASEEQKARIAALKAKVQEPEDEEVADDGFLDALNGSAKADWSDEELESE